MSGEAYGACSVCGETTRHTVAVFLGDSGVLVPGPPRRVCRTRPCRVKTYGSEAAAAADSRGYLMEFPAVDLRAYQLPGFPGVDLEKHCACDLLLSSHSGRCVNCGGLVPS